jgi:hypothetical protein
MAWLRDAICPLPWSAFLKLSASSEAVGGGLGTATVDMASDP